MKKGFTLIELIVVIAVIGILASITLTGLARLKGSENCLETRETCVQKCFEQEEECSVKLEKRQSFKGRWVGNKGRRN